MEVFIFEVKNFADFLVLKWKLPKSGDTDSGKASTSLVRKVLSLCPTPAAVHNQGCGEIFI